MLLAGYQFSFSKTWELWRSNRDLRYSTANIDELTLQLQVLSQQKLRIDSVKQTQRTSINDLKVFQVLSAQAERSNVTLYEYAERKKSGSDEVYNYFRFEGNFKSLLAFLYAIESRSLGGDLVSVSFNSQEDRRTGVFKLYLSMYFPKNEES